MKSGTESRQYQSLPIARDSGARHYLTNDRYRKTGHFSFVFHLFWELSHPIVWSDVWKCYFKCHRNRLFNHPDMAGIFIAVSYNLLYRSLWSCKMSNYYCEMSCRRRKDDWKTKKIMSDARTICDMVATKYA